MTSYTADAIEIGIDPVREFSDKNYQFSGGLHDVGVSVVNALSQYVIVTVKRDGALLADEVQERRQGLRIHPGRHRREAPERHHRAVPAR